MSAWGRWQPPANGNYRGQSPEQEGLIEADRLLSRLQWRCSLTAPVLSTLFEFLTGESRQQAIEDADGDPVDRYSGLSSASASFMFPTL